MRSENPTASSLPPSKRFFYWLIGGVVLCNFIVGYAFLYASVRQRSDAVNQAALNAQNLVQAISQSIQYSSEKLDISLQSTVFALEKQLREQNAIEPVSIANLLAEQRPFHIDTRPLEITDAAGNVIFKEGPDSLPSANLADTSYFQLLRQGQQSATQLTNFVCGREPSELVILSAYSYHKPDGSFAGIVLAPVPLDYFQGFLKGLKLPEKSLLSITTTQNVLVALRAEADTLKHLDVGQQQAVSGEYARLQAQGIDSGTYQADSAVDGIPRLYAFQHVKQTPLIVKAGLADSYYMKTWNEIVLMRIGVFVTLLLICLILCSILFLLWRKQVRYAADMETNNTRLRTLLQVREVALFELDYVTDIWTPSPEQEFIFGIDSDYPHTRQSWVKLVHPDDIDFLRAAVTRDFESRSAYFKYEYRIIRPADGKIRWLQVNGQFEYLPHQTPGRMFGAIKDITSLRESQQRVDHLAYYDDLTGLPNRVLLTERLQQAMLRIRRHRGTLVVCSLDLDRFKQVNDTWGHSVGNQLLCEVAQRIISSLREEDTVARIGGDEFVLLLSGMEQPLQINTALERIRNALAEPFALTDTTISVTASMGVTTFPGDEAADADTMLRHADQAMHEAKHAGKNGIHWFDHETDRRQFEAHVQYERLVQALEKREFVLYYQPKVDLHSDNVEGVEALIRWMHPEEGLLPPSRFLPVIENTDLCVPLGEWILREALGQNQLWRNAGISLKVGVNVFPHHLQQADFSKQLAKILQEFPAVPPGTLNLEVVETSLLKDLTEVSRRIKECSTLGVDFSLDDFGTGYSSLSYFSRLPVSIIKVDQSFTRSILNSPADLALVQSIVGMSHSIGRQVVAEGVETPEHGLPLIACGCDIAQGYGVARPMPGDHVPGWTAAWRRPAIWL